MDRLQNQVKAINVHHKCSCNNFPILGAGYLSHIEAGGELDEDEEEVDSTNMPKLGLRQVKSEFEIYQVFEAQTLPNFR